jgi:hypothetical protein
MRWLRPFTMIALPVAGGLLGLSVIALRSGGDSGSTAAATAPAIAATPTEAIAAVVQAGGASFAGPCEQTRSPEDIGKLCARFVEQRDGVQAHLVGPTFSEFTTWLFLEQAASGWTVVTSIPLDFHDAMLSIPWPR